MAGVDEALFVDVFERVRGYRPYPAQVDAISSTSPATWVLAGPGTGKTEVLVLRTLKLLLVDQFHLNQLSSRRSRIVQQITF